VAFAPASWVPWFDEGRGRAHLDTVLNEHSRISTTQQLEERYEGREDCTVSAWMGMACPHTNALDRVYRLDGEPAAACESIRSGSGELVEAPDGFELDDEGGCSFEFDLDPSSWLGGYVYAEDGGTRLTLVAGEDPRLG